MSLSPGTTLGSFEITDLLGKGGMGAALRASSGRASLRASGILPGGGVTYPPDSVFARMTGGLADTTKGTRAL